MAPDRGADEALELVRKLAVDIGARRPCSVEEQRAAELLADWLDEHGAHASLEPFGGYPTFGYLWGPILGAAFAAGLLQARGRRTGDALLAASLAGAALEGDLRVTPLSAAVSRWHSVNLTARAPAAGPPRQVVCMCGHLDSTRSGLLFHPRAVPHLPLLLNVPGAAAGLLGLASLLRRHRSAKALQIAGFAGLAVSLAFVVERELRGRDVPGANDNASGAAVATQLLAECAESPLEHTEVRLLVSGCEESGVLGAQAYARRHAAEAARTVFLNFDTVGGDVPLTYLAHEPSMTGSRDAAPRLLALAEEVAAGRPDLELARGASTPGLQTDVTVFLARGWEGITFLAQAPDGRVPNYHWPTDTYENVSPGAIGRALEAGREMLSELDRRAG